MPHARSGGTPAGADFWQSTLDSLPDGLAVLDAGGGIVTVNRSWSAFALANGGSGAGTGVGADYLAACDPEGTDGEIAEGVRRGLLEMIAGSSTRFTCIYPCHAPQQNRWFEMQVEPFDIGGTRHIVVNHHDITMRYEVQQSDHRKAELLSAVGAAVVATDLDGLVTHWSAGAERLYGRPASEILGRPLSALTVAEEDRKLADRMLRSAIEGEGPRQGQLEVLHRDGRRIPAWVRNGLLRDTAGRPAGVSSVVVDLTERVAGERQLRGARDFLAAVAQTMPDGLLVLDSDGRLRLVNQAAESMLGWRMGDYLGESMTRKLLPRETAAVRTPADGSFLHRDGSSLPVSYSSAPLVSGAGDEGRVVVFNDITKRKARESLVHRELVTLSWLDRIRQALEGDLFVLYAQPIVEIATGRTVQHELLVRMLGADGDAIAPSFFLPIAEEHGLIQAIDRRVFGLAFPYAAAGHPIQVNLSAASIADPGLFRIVRDGLAACGADPRLVGFEITETALIHDEGAAQFFIERVREIGGSVALDDFGSGYGSFRYLKHLPVSMLKIDHEFVRELDGSEGDANRHVLGAIVRLARGMGKQTVAEGVETESSLAFVRDLGIDFAQGYLFGRPAPIAEVLRGDGRKAEPG